MPRDRSIDPAVYLAILGEQAPTAAVDHMTITRGQFDWNRGGRAFLEREGVQNIEDSETKRILTPDILDAFGEINRESAKLNSTPFHLVETDRFPSRQAACEAIEGCSDWSRFSRIGYNSNQTLALVYEQNENPRYSQMGMGRYVLLTREDGVWRVFGFRMAWIS